MEFYLKVIFRRWMFGGDSKYFILNVFTLFGWKLYDLDWHVMYLFFYFIVIFIIKFCKHIGNPFIQGFNFRYMSLKVRVKFVAVIFCYRGQLFFWSFNTFIIWKNISLEFSLKVICRTCMFRGESKNLNFEWVKMKTFSIHHGVLPWTLSIILPLFQCFDQMEKS